METEADAATNAAKQAVEETTRTVDSWLERRRRIAQQNDTAEDADRQRYFREKEEAIRIRNAALRARWIAAGYSESIIDRILGALPEDMP